MDNGEGCNLIVFDLLICAILVTIMAHKKFDFTVSLILGIGAGVLLVFLMTLKYVGIIIQIILGFAWGLLIYDVINPSGIVGIVVIIISVILGELLHFASYNQLMGDNYISVPTKKVTHVQVVESEELVRVNEQEQFRKRIKIFYQRYLDAVETQKVINERVIEICRRWELDILFEEYSQFRFRVDPLWGSLENKRQAIYSASRFSQKVQELCFAEKYLESIVRQQINIMQRYKEFKDYILLYNQKSTSQKNTEQRQEKENSANSKNVNNERKKQTIDDSLFNGCTDKASLTKRYKELLKVYHPDNANGDQTMTIKITNTFNYLKTKYE